MFAYKSAKDCSKVVWNSQWIKIGIRKTKFYNYHHIFAKSTTKTPTWQEKKNQIFFLILLWLIYSDQKINYHIPHTIRLQWLFNLNQISSVFL